MGASENHAGSRPLRACARMTAMGLRSSSLARASLATTRAAAPSLTPGALPAVTVPPSLNAGLSRARISTVVPGRMDSSASKTRGRLAFLGRGNLDGKNLVAEDALRRGRGGAAVRLSGEGILLVAR